MLGSYNVRSICRHTNRSPGSVGKNFDTASVVGLDSGQGAVVLELDEAQLCLPGLLVDEVVVVLQKEERHTLTRPDAQDPNEFFILFFWGGKE